jgi:5-methylcytosine-specific restriction protein A
LIVCIEQR